MKQIMNYALIAAVGIAIIVTVGYPWFKSEATTATNAATSQLSQGVSNIP